MWFWRHRLLLSFELDSFKLRMSSILTEPCPSALGSKSGKHRETKWLEPNWNESAARRMWDWTAVIVKGTKLCPCFWVVSVWDDWSVELGLNIVVWVEPFEFWICYSLITLTCKKIIHSFSYSVEVFQKTFWPYFICFLYFPSIGRSIWRVWHSQWTPTKTESAKDVGRWDYFIYVHCMTKSMGTPARPSHSKIMAINMELVSHLLL